MKAIYEPKGRAKEYADLACNLAVGCPHGCVYCYGPGAAFMDRGSFEVPRIREGIILEALEREAPKYRGRQVHFCFLTDPCATSELMDMTIAATRILNRHGVGVSVLTKGTPTRTLLDTLALGHGLNAYGATLTTINTERALMAEPGAALPGTRFASLRQAHDLGIRTWVSLEPVLWPEDTLDVIEWATANVDEIRVGKCNHISSLPAWLRADVERINWPAFRSDVVALLRSLGYSDEPGAVRRYMIKRDLREAT